MGEAINLSLRRDFTGTRNQTNVLLDYDGHGTAVGSIISGSAGNGFGIAGIAPGSTVVPLRIGSTLSLSLLGSSSAFRNLALEFATE